MKKLFVATMLAMYLGVIAVGCGGPEPAPADSVSGVEHDANATEEHDSGSAEHEAE